MTAASRLRALMKQGTVVAPGVYDGLSAKLAQLAGFDVIYATGGGIARSSGLPDLGILDAGVVVNRLEQIVDASGLPVIADLDTGFGNALNARQVARAFERAGVAGFHVEDQTFPKRCGHYEDKSVVPTAEFVQKIRAIKDVLHDADTLVIARTDAIAIEGLDSALERAHAYAQAGADVIFVEAPTSVEQIETIGRELPYPKLMNMFKSGKTPMVPVARLTELGYAIVIIPSDLQRAAMKAMVKVLEAIKRDGNSMAVDADLASFAEREASVGTARFLEIEKRFAA
ncbi:MAG: isocitrate lyase and phosphorylmutase [Rhizobacter sp.]|nr:isocitrate lyase and phosphorylmutase [Rhizobacter sp.]